MDLLLCQPGVKWQIFHSVTDETCLLRSDARVTNDQSTGPPRSIRYGKVAVIRNQRPDICILKLCLIDDNTWSSDIACFTADQ